MSPRIPQDAITQFEDARASLGSRAEEFVRMYEEFSAVRVNDLVLSIRRAREADLDPLGLAKRGGVAKCLLMAASVALCCAFLAHVSGLDPSAVIRTYAGAFVASAVSAAILRSFAIQKKACLWTDEKTLINLAVHLRGVNALCEGAGSTVDLVKRRIGILAMLVIRYESPDAELVEALRFASYFGIVSFDVESALSSARRRQQSASRA